LQQLIAGDGIRNAFQFLVSIIHQEVL